MITLDQVKQLREKTGAGMGDCKKALEASGGDMQAAIEYLRKKGAASAAKRSDRIANEGMVYALVSSDGKRAALVEVNCETDFVARNEQFGAFVRAIAEAVLATGATEGDALWNYSLGDKTLGNLRDEVYLKFAERIELRRAEFLKRPARSPLIITPGIVWQLSWKPMCRWSRTITSCVILPCKLLP